MTTRRPRFPCPPPVWPFVVVGLSAVLTGCAVASATAPREPATVVRTTAAPTPISRPKAKPTTTQAMVCGAEIRGKVKEVLALRARPVTQASFAAGLYTCVYHLPNGPMRLSVRHSAGKAAALAYFERRSLARRARIVLPGLGNRARSAWSGVVLVLKDDETLEVDTTGLPTVFGPNQQKRSDLANEIASDVLGCWTGDDDS